MKKYIILFIVLILAFLPINVFADDSLYVSRWIVTSELMENGDLQVAEDITFNFNEKFNGVFKDIIFRGSDGIENLSISEVINNDEISYSIEQNAEKGDTNVYNYDQDQDSINIMLFSPAENEEKTFRFNYTIKNVAIIHNDIGELYYQYIGDENQTRIDYFQAILVLPQFNKDDIKIFAHGPLNGNINFADNNLIRLEVSSVPSNTFVEVRVLYPKDYTPLATRFGNSRFDALMDEELGYLEEIEQKAERREANKSITNNVSIISLAIGALALFVFYRKNRRDHSIYYDMENTQLDDISPAELNLFMNSAIDSRAIMATLFDLTRREYIHIDEMTKDENRIYGKSSKREEFKFLKKSSLDNNLLEHERYLLNWLLNTIGDGEEFTTLDIEHFRKKQMTQFNKGYSEWSRLVKEELSTRGYSDDNNKTSGLIIILLGVAITIAAIISLVYENSIGIVAVIIGIILFVLGFLLMFRKSDKGYVQYNLWKDIKNGLSKYDNVDISIPKDKTLIYAVALGLSMKQLNERRRYYDNDYYPMYWGYWYFAHMNKRGGSAFEDSFNNSFNGYTGTSSPNSTNFGSGGGFSGGGGGGAGGGGVGGF